MRFHALAIVAAVLTALLLVACGDDDAADGDPSPADTDAPTASAPPDDGSDGESTDGDDGDDGGDDVSPSFSEDFGAEPAGSGGPATIIIGDETFEYEVIVCSTSEDGLTVWNGRGHTADGTPFVAEVSWMFGFEVITEVSIGSETVSDDGDPHWTAEPALDYAAGANGVASLTYDASFTSSGGEAAEGSVDVVCRL